MTGNAADAMRLLFGRAFDYAGLYPPASLALDEVLAAYTRYREGAHAWALGRLVVPAARLGEIPTRVGPLAVVLDAERAADLGWLRPFAVDGGRLALEARAADVPGIETIAAARGRLSVPIVVELPVGGDVSALVASLHRHRLIAKVRTGGVTAEAIPPPSALLAFIDACVQADVPLKVTAGLHHSIRGTYPLTYEPSSARGVMHGFANVFLATAALVAGDSTSAAGILEETERAAFRFDADTIGWRDLRFDADGITRSRRLLVACGTCSFEEPMADLQALGWLR
jgi:hypothetical protein